MDGLTKKHSKQAVRENTAACQENFSRANCGREIKFSRGEITQSIAATDRNHSRRRLAGVRSREQIRRVSLLIRCLRWEDLLRSGCQQLAYIFITGLREIFVILTDRLKEYRHG